MILWFLLGAALVAGGIVAWGWHLPRSRYSSHDVLIDAPAEQVWSVMTDFLRQVEWRTDLLSVEMGANRPGEEMWTERPRRGPASACRVTRHKPARTLEVERLPNGISAGQWSATLEPAAKATRVTLTETLHIPNPLERVIAGWRFNAGGFAQNYARDLKRCVEAQRAAVPGVRP